MKPFNLEKAKNGAAVCLEDGTPVKILDFDFNGDILYKVKVTQDSGRTLEGTIVVDQKGVRRENGYDGKNLNLYMAPIVGYMCVLKNVQTGKLIGYEIYSNLSDAEFNEAIPLGCTCFGYAKVELLD